MERNEVKKLLPELEVMRVIMATDIASAERQREYTRWVIRREVIEECIRLIELESEAGEPTLEQRERIEAAGAVAIGRAAIRATKASIIRRLRALKEEG